MRRTGEAAICWFIMVLLLIMAFLSFRQGNPRAGGVMVALAALAMAAGSTLARKP